MEYSKMTTEQMAECLVEAIHDGASISDAMHIIGEWKKDLQHHYDTTKGLWATDRPDLVVDEKKILFQI